jgi:hypothetical protein
VFAQNGAENLLANRFAHSKANKDLKPSKAVPKKSKIVQAENSRSIADGSLIDKRPSRLRSTGKTKPATKKKTSAKARTGKSSKPSEPSDEEIRIRAYFVSERRQRLDLPGDANTDWLEAKRQLSEIGPR